jgi:hypothetical protein
MSRVLALVALSLAIVALDVAFIYGLFKIFTLSFGG